MAPQQTEGGCVAMTAEPHGMHRTPEEIRAALNADRTSLRTVRDALPAEDQEAFDHAYWHAIDKAKLSYDLKPVLEFQKRWWWIAYEKADPAECADTIARAERAMEYLERGETPPGAVIVDDAYKQRMRERIEQGE